MLVFSQTSYVFHSSPALHKSIHAASARWVASNCGVVVWASGCFLAFGFGESFFAAFGLGGSPCIGLDAFRFGDFTIRSVAFGINAGDSGLAMASATRCMRCAPIEPRLLESLELPMGLGLCLRLR